MTTGTVRHVRRKWPGYGFAVGCMAVTAGNAIVMRAVERGDMRIGHHRRPRGRAMTCVTTAGGDEMAAIHPRRGVAVMASRTSARHHIGM